MDPNIIFWSHAENQLSKPFANGFYRQFFRTLLITAIRQHKIHSASLAPALTQHSAKVVKPPPEAEKPNQTKPAGKVVKFGGGKAGAGQRWSRDFRFLRLKIGWFIFVAFSW